MQGLDHVLRSYTYRYVCIILCIKVFTQYILYVTLTVNNYMILSYLYHEEPHPSEIFFYLNLKL
jgi:hypothetical protein